MAAGFISVLATAAAAGPVLTAAAAATCLPVTAKCTLPPNAFYVGSQLDIYSSGFISCVVTTPGTARISFLLGGTTIYDSGPYNLNIVAKVTLPWRFTARLTCRTIGAAGNFIGDGLFVSEAIIASPLGTVGGNGQLLSEVSGGVDTALTNPGGTVGGNVDLTVANAFDMFFTQTVATGSFSVTQFSLTGLAVAVP